MPERNHLMELWYNRPWRYIPAVVRHMQRWPFGTAKLRRGGITFKEWITHIMYINWQIAYYHDTNAAPAYPRCADCLCDRCENKKCKRKNCSMCDKLHKVYAGKGMTTVTCARRHIVEQKDTI